MENLLPSYLNWVTFMDGKDDYLFKTENTEQSQPNLTITQKVPSPSTSSIVVKKEENQNTFDPSILSQISPELAAHIASLGAQTGLKNVVPIPAQVMLLATQQQLANAKRNRVKRPMNSFLLFSNEMRPILQAQNKDQSNAQISKLLGNAWKALPGEEKVKFVERAAKIKLDFSAAHPDYVYTKTPRKHKKRKLSVEKELNDSEELMSPESELSNSISLPDLTSYDNYFNPYEFGIQPSQSLMTSLQTITPSDLSALSNEDRLVSEAFE